MIEECCEQAGVTGSPYGESRERESAHAVDGRRSCPASHGGISVVLEARSRTPGDVRRLRGEPPPWTDDPVLSVHRFTNAYRASDRVSQFLINDVIYGGPVDERSTVLRVLLFKIFNRIETWRLIESRCGTVTVDSFDPDCLAELLDDRLSAGERLYSAAYIMPSPKLGAARKHVNHLHLLQQLLTDGTIDSLVEASSLRELYTRRRASILSGRS